MVIEIRNEHHRRTKERFAAETTTIRIIKEDKFSVAAEGENCIVISQQWVLECVRGLRSFHHIAACKSVDSAVQSSGTIYRVNILPPWVVGSYGRLVPSQTSNVSAGRISPNYRCKCRLLTRLSSP